jgi:hypothetical protein
VAAWTLARLVNRTDAWGEYRPAWEIGRTYTRADGTTGTLGEQKTCKGHLALPRLVRHYRATGRADIAGLHSADANNQGKWGALDIDQHGEDLVRAEANRLAALHWHGELVRRGFHPLLTASNGKGGYHLRVLLAEAIPADRLYWFLKLLTRDHQRFGFPKHPEHFPKQADVRRCTGKFGNWLRLPGPHHKRDYFSEVWDDSAWLGGHAAIDFLLSLRGDDPGLIPDVPPAPSPAPRRSCRISAAGGNLSPRIAAYMRRLPHLALGQGRDDVAFNFACFLVRDLALPDYVALPWLEAWDSGNSPPKGKERLAAILANARSYGQKPLGAGLDGTLIVEL